MLLPRTMAGSNLPQKESKDISHSLVNYLGGIQVQVQYLCVYYLLGG